MEFDEIFHLVIDKKQLPKHAHLEEVGAYYALDAIYRAYQIAAIPKEMCMELKNEAHRDFTNIRFLREQLKELTLNSQLCAFRAAEAGRELIRRSEPGADQRELLMLAADCISHMRGEEESSLRKTLERRLRGEFSVAEMAERKKEQEERANDV